MRNFHFFSKGLRDASCPACSPATGGPRERFRKTCKTGRFRLPTSAESPAVTRTGMDSDPLLSLGRTSGAVLQEQSAPVPPTARLPSLPSAWRRQQKSTPSVAASGGSARSSFQRREPAGGFLCVDDRFLLFPTSSCSGRPGSARPSGFMGVPEGPVCSDAGLRGAALTLSSARGSDEGTRRRLPQEVREFLRTHLLRRLQMVCFLLIRRLDWFYKTEQVRVPKLSSAC